MKILMAIGGSSALVGGLYAGGALTSGQVYPMPLSVVRSQLVTMTVPPQLLQAGGGSDAATAVVESSAGNIIRWRIFVGNRQVSEYQAVLAAESPTRTRVTLSQAARPADTAADKLLSTRFIRGYGESILEEQVDARLTGRSFDYDGAAHAYARNVANDPAAMRELGESVRGMFQETAKHMRADSEEGVQRVTSPRAQMKAATRPSLDLSNSD